MTAAQQRAYVQGLDQKLSALASQVIGLGGRELGRVTKAHTALIVSIDSSQANRLTSLTGVAGVRPLGDYQMALSSTVPYIGAGINLPGVSGANIKVAVLDSGVDYTHRNLGGPGTVAAYNEAYGTATADLRNKTRDGLFPTAKVYDGYDFVGEQWPNGPRAPDPDPIDFDGHGTHVADIIAGLSTDGLHKGVAPGARIMAVKVCSSVATSCSGVASLLGVDYALDPNGDSDLSDAVDVMNLSLGSGYGQREDDLSEALRLVSVFGVVVVAAAGNDADRPYIVGSPSTAPAVISVAQTQVPNAKGLPLLIVAPAAIAGTYPNTETLDFAPVGSGWTNLSTVPVGRGCPAGSIDATNPDDPYLVNPAGKIALIDRGACNVSSKIDRAAKAGAAGVLLGLVASGDAVGFSLGGGDTFIPSLVITQATSNAIKAQASSGQTVLTTVSLANAISLAGSMAGSSARGPGYSYSAIKPDIGAPGASVSAEVGTGNGETAFSGTSGATPMISGAAALLLETCPTCAPYEIKARLMNTAETAIFTNPKTVPGELAPITRIGGGEVRVNRAANVRTLAWDAGDPTSVSMSFGSVRMDGPVSLTKKMLVKNLTGITRTYSVTPEFRYANDVGGPVTITAPPTITVPANGTATFNVTLSIPIPTNLPGWSLNGGNRGGDGFRLQSLEYDGFLRISDSMDTIHVPWHILPHRAAGVTASPTSLGLTAGAGQIAVVNTGAIGGALTAFSLLGVSPKQPANFLPRPGDNFAIVDLRAAGVRFVPNGAAPGNDLIQIGINTWGERAHPNYPAEFDVFLDVNDDGVDDYVVFNSEGGGFAASGTNVTGVVSLAPGATPQTAFFTSADLGSANVTLNVASSTIPLGYDPNARWRITVCAGDNYYTGFLTDCLPTVAYTLSKPRFTASPSSGTLPANAAANLSVAYNPAANSASPGQAGILLLYGDAKSGREADIITVNP